MTAAELGHEEVVDLLLRRGADSRLKDAAGKTAAEIASSDVLRAKLAGLEHDRL
jgi:ankyrin repeat protein